MMFVMCAAGSTPAQIVVTNVAVADTFVPSLYPTSNFGGAGALSVSGLLATNAIGQTNGLIDTFMRFDVSGAVSNFNSTLGPGRWAISRISMVLSEQGSPNNPIFNRGVGQFLVQWIATNSWAEGTGTPNNPTTDGIVWNDEPSLLNSNMDESLGTFVNGGTDGWVRLTLGMPSLFASNMVAGGVVSFYMTATSNSTVGFTFHSHNFVTPSEWPFLEIVAVPVPHITSLAITGSNVNISFTTTNSLSYVVEYKPDLTVGGWIAVTNLTGISGAVTITDFGAATLPKRFYRVGVVVP